MTLTNDDIKPTVELYGKDISAPFDNPLDVSLLYDYHAYVYKTCRSGKELISIYKKNNVGMFAIGLTAVSNEITFVINRRLTRKIKPADLSVEVKVKVDATSDFIDSRAVTSGTADLFPIGLSASPNSMS